MTSAPIFNINVDSGIDATIPADNDRVAKADLRTNFAGASNSIEALQAYVSMPRRIIRGEQSVSD